MTRSALRLLPIMALTAGLATAADVEHRIRLGFDVLPTDVESEVTASSGGFSVSADGEGEYENAGRVTLQYSARIGEQVAAIIGGGLSYGQAEFEDDTGEIAEFGGIVEAGLSLRLAPWFDLEAVIPLGFGGARLALGDNDANDDDEAEDVDGAYFDAALLLRPVVTLGEHVQLFGQVGYIVRRETFKDDDDRFDLELELEQDGLIAGLGVGVVF